jgi:tetratricopeptide (TPR) repeat protein
MTAGDSGRLYATGTWKPGPQLGPGTPYDSTTDLAVLGQTNGIYRLVELATGRELAKLEDPEQNSGPAAFTADGARLVTSAKNGMRVWDLRRIREGLMELNLDWDAPPFPPEKQPLSTLQVTVNLGALDPAVRDLIAQTHIFLRKGDLTGALEVIQKAHTRAPDDPSLNNDLAWMLATWPDVKLRDPKRAVELAKKAVQLMPANGDYWITLGVAHYRVCDWKAAVASLSKSRELNQGSEAINWLFLAMSHRKLGNDAVSRKAYDQAVQWLEKNSGAFAKNKTQAEELGRFRSEAEEVLELKKKK